jgi:hypothetical protein
MSVLARAAVRSKRAHADSLAPTWVWGTTVALVCLALASLKMSVLESDAFFDLNVGRYIAQHGIPRANHLTVTSAGARWVDQQWLAHWFLYEAWRVGGYAAVVLATSLALSVGTFIFFRVLVAAGVALPRAWIFTLVAVAMEGQVMVARAQVLAVPLFALIVLLTMRQAKVASLRPLLWTLPVLCLWANIHGSVLVGALLVCGVAISFAARTRRWTALLVAGASLLTPFVMPYSPSATLSYYRALLNNPILSHIITEWEPQTLNLGWGLFFFIPLFAVLIGYGFAAGRRYWLPWPLTAMLLVTFVVGMRAVRFGFWFSWPATIAVALLVQRFASPLATPPPRLRQAVGAACVAGAALSTLIVAVLPTSWFEGSQGRAAISAVRRGAGANRRVLADELASNFVIWRIPTLTGRVAYDSRFEQYTTSQQQRFYDWVEVSSPEWMEAAKGYDVLVASPRNTALEVRLLRLPGWRTTYAGSDGVVVVRKTRN